MRRKAFLLMTLVLGLTLIHKTQGATGSGGEILYPFQDYTLPIETRVADLLSRLTLEEKVLLLNAGAGAIPRLGIKEYNYGSEALHGIAGPGKFTVFPQAIALASTWDPSLVTQVTAAISDEAWGAINAAAAEKGYPGERFLSFWSPTVNMARDPRWGRTPETYGEDPYLTSRIGVAFVKGLQGDDARYLKAVSTPKHFAANNEEHNRFRCNAKISERTLREYYFPGFKACIMEGGAQSVMGAYNAVNGIPCNANKWLLTDVLRGDWGFDGYVVTDCGALGTMIGQHQYAKNREEAAAFAINAGVDIECGGEQILRNDIIGALNKGLVSEAVIDQAVSRLLRVRFRLGMFDPPELIPYTMIPAGVVGCEKHSQLARQVSRESIVLLKNDAAGGKPGNPFLPLDARRIRSIAVVGPNAAEALFGDYSGTPVNTPVTPLDGIRNKAGDRIKVTNIPWIQAPIIEDYAAVPTDNLRPPADAAGARGLKAEYFAGLDLAGKPETTRVESGVNLHGANLPASAAGGAWSVRWTGKFVPSVSGAHYLYIAAAGNARMWLDGRLIYEKKPKKKKPAIEAGKPLDSFSMDTQGERRQSAIIMVEAGRAYDIVVEYTPGKGDALARLEWVPPAGEAVKIRALEMKAIKESDVVIAVMGLWRALEHENIDRIDLDVPFDQTEYMKQVMRLNPNAAVVLINGSPISVNWFKENAPAIIEAWYPGEQGGNAIADVLFGDYNPGGRLPMTFYKSVDDLPAFDDYEVSLRARTYMYFDKEPLFPFGYGLSYTTFEYGNLKIDDRKPKADGFIGVSLDLKNTGGREGDEVVQLYAHDVESSVKQPKKQLKAFRRIHLEKGETQTVLFRLAVGDLSFWDEETKRFIVEPGEFEILVGASSADIRLKDRIAVQK